MIDVLIVAEIPLYREGIARALALGNSVRVVGTATGLQEALARVKDLQPQVVLVDFALSESHDTVRAISEAYPDTRVVALAVSDTEADVITCAESGAAGYVPKDGSLEDIEAVVESVTRGEALCTPKIAASLLRRVGTLAAELHGPPPNVSLTSREAEVAALVDEGLSNKEIAERLGIAIPTVKNHVHNILDKLHVHRRTEAAARLR
jgi:two-component system, NarL family, nitrate/nitrite response regulator NarL